jgi:hypothetical protein
MFGRAPDGGFLLSSPLLSLEATTVAACGGYSDDSDKRLDKWFRAQSCCGSLIPISGSPLRGLSQRRFQRRRRCEEAWPSYAPSLPRWHPRRSCPALLSSTRGLPGGWRCCPLGDVGQLPNDVPSLSPLPAGVAGSWRVGGMEAASPSGLRRRRAATSPGGGRLRAPVADGCEPQ